ncbi:unnamed protein product [Bemisia tabaci]|uniref:Uncharacterized protein n=1 Tax=Bemisia tabaci TaxID=7038 RepID=A0A9P0AHR8_BEMTA|nr:unnamed protein product [Bemisia tabaci]
MFFQLGSSPEQNEQVLPRSPGNNRPLTPRRRRRLEKHLQDLQALLAQPGSSTGDSRPKQPRKTSKRATSLFSPVSNEELAIEEAEAAYNWWEVATDDEELALAFPEAPSPRAPTTPRPRPAPTPPPPSPIVIGSSSPSPAPDSVETVRLSPPANLPRKHSPPANIPPRRVLLQNKAIQTPLELIFSLFPGYQERNVEKKRLTSVRRASGHQRVNQQQLHPRSYRHPGSFTPRRRHPYSPPAPLAAPSRDREHSPPANIPPRRVLLQNKAIQTLLEFIFSLFHGYQEGNIG